MKAKKSSRSRPIKTNPPRPRRAHRARSAPTAEWAVLCYIAGDVGGLSPSLRGDLAEILAAGATAEVSVAVQYDGPDGAARYVLPRQPAPKLAPTETLGRLNSGTAAVLAEFLRWGLSVCPAERVALVLGGLNALDPAAASEDAEARTRARVFTICRDDSAGGYMDVVDLGAVIRDVLAERGRSQLELLAIDSCHTQFLELAYELEGRVAVLLAPQTLVPGSGWNYTTVLRAWHRVAREAKGAPDSEAVARALLPAIAESYRVPGRGEGSSVSALDLRRLDDVARAFDTFCIGMMQALGEGLIWETRRLLLRLFDERPHRAQPDAYDAGSFFALMEAALNAMADEACQGWLGTTLQRVSGPAFDRFRMAVARQLEQHTNEARDRRRIRQVLDALRAKDTVAAGKRLHQEIGAGIAQRIESLAPGQSTEAARSHAEATARERDVLLEDAVRAEFRLLPPERQFDFERLKDSVDTARRLARQARHAALMLLGSGIDRRGSADAAESRPGMVITEVFTVGQADGWPRWSGVSLYRPQKLNDLMNASYQRFAFHRRVHWAALLGAGNLIEQHPRALWRLVSSLLSTGAAGTRRDVLRRLTGPDSVIWGLRDQFRVLAPAPALTLSLERRHGAFDGEMSPPPPESVEGAEADADPNAKADRENYLLRLESVTRGAVITEQRSRVQPAVMDRALRELDRVLAADAATPDLLRRLKAIGGLLGEDIFQSLGRTLEEERVGAMENSANTHAHLQLQIPRELMRYPWELLHHRGEWLSERFAMGRQVFMETGLARRVTRRQQGQVRPLIIGDPLLDRGRGWAQLPGARAEAEQIAGWFQRLSEEVGEVVNFDPRRDTRIHTRLTSADFRELLRSGQYDIIHFAGHGVFHGDDPETSAWLLSDGELWALEIRNTLADHPAPPWLVYANACEAAMESDRPARSYQGNVFGLATAFINQGVAAYLAPLWPIDDLLAQHIALEFYRHLLCGRATLGEALRRAKADARQLAYPDDAAMRRDENASWAGLGWASLVLYGDPTEELFQALAGSGRRPRIEPEAAAPTEDTTVRRRARAATGPTVRCLHAPDHVLSAWVQGPGFTPRSTETRRGAEPLGKGEIELELIEEAGLRRWRQRGSQEGSRGAKRGAEVTEGTDALPGSDLARLLADDQVRHLLPGRRGVIRVIGRWLLSGFEGGLTGLVREYDREQVASEGLFLLPDGDPKSMTPLTHDALRGNGAGGSDRVLVLVHGTFSKTASPVEGLGPAFLEFARKRYRAVVGLDHWTLSKTPLENAEMLAEQLRILDPDLLTERRLDFITHSRGGLVARAFCELLGHAPAVRHLIFAGTPNCGTDLANPQNWGAMADALINFTGLDHAELFGRLAGLLARLAVMGIEQNVPGLRAQNPLMAGVAGEFLHKLQSADAEKSGVRHAIVTSEFAPTPLIPNLKALAKAAAAGGADAVLDRFFKVPNDLVVNTANTWCIDQPPNKNEQLPSFVKPDRVLLFQPPHSNLTPPARVEMEVALGVHHSNLLSQPRTQERMKLWLSEP